MSPIKKSQQALGTDVLDARGPGLSKAGRREVRRALLSETLSGFQVAESHLDKIQIPCSRLGNRLNRMLSDGIGDMGLGRIVSSRPSLLLTELGSEPRASRMLGNGHSLGYIKVNSGVSMTVSDQEGRMSW